MGSLFFALVVIVWWAFFSRSAWMERLAGLAVLAATLGVTWLLKHDSMSLPWLFAYAIPVLFLAFVTWAVATRNLPARIRRATMVATLEQLESSTPSMQVTVKFSGRATPHLRPAPRSPSGVSRVRRL